MMDADEEGPEAVLIKEDQPVNIEITQAVFEQSQSDYKEQTYDLQSLADLSAVKINLDLSEGLSNEISVQFMNLRERQGTMKQPCRLN